MCCWISPRSPTRALMVHAHDPTKHIVVPSQRSPSLPVTFISLTLAGLTEFLFSWKVLSSAAPQSSCHETNITVKIFPLPKKRCFCREQSGRDFSLIAHLSTEQVVACRFSHLKVFVILFLFLRNTIFSVMHQYCARCMTAIGSKRSLTH